MINQLHKLLHDPARGWDPISSAYAQEYGAAQTAAEDVVAQFAAATGGLHGKRVLDLGSGVGQYGLAFASQGATVTCLDVSATYLRMARDRFSAAGAHGRCVLS